MAARPSRILARGLAAMVATTLVVLPTPAMAAAFGPAASTSVAMYSLVQDSEIERLYAEGQARYGDGDFAGAADSWTRLLEKMPESQAAKATRENVLLNITQAYLDAYNRSRGDDGKKDIEHLRKGKAVLDDYFAGYRKAYGDRAGVSQAVQEKSDELEEELRKAEEDLAASAAAAANTENGAGDGGTDGGGTDPTDGGQQKVIVLKPQSTGNGLIVGGGVVAFLGIGALAMGIIGAVRAPKAEEDFNNATSDLAREEAQFRGTQANQLTIAGFVLAPLLLAGGGVMIFFGVKQKQRAAAESSKVALTPSVGPRFTGLSLSGRF